MFNTIETEIQESRLQRQSFSHRVAKFLDGEQQEQLAAVVAGSSPRTKRSAGVSPRRKGQIVTPRRSKPTDIKFTINNQEAYFDITSALERDAIQKEASDLRGVFDFLDKNKDGYICAKDLKRVLQWLNHDCSEVRADCDSRSDAYRKADGVRILLLLADRPRRKTYSGISMTRVPGNFHGKFFRQCICECRPKTQLLMSRVACTTSQIF
eukprot:SAG31_NODE_1860_length_7048_cov_6.740325_2_plen_210_part_00